MAINITDIYHRQPKDYGLRMKRLMDENLPFFCREYQSTSPPSMRRWKAKG